jgi:hypothetical protein
MNKRKSQLERVRGRVDSLGVISRNQCLDQRPPITRLASRIKDLETKHGYVFTTENTGRDYIYRLVSINGVPRGAPLTRSDHLRMAAEAVKFFDDYRVA